MSSETNNTPVRRYIDMTPDERLEAHTRATNARLAIEGYSSHRRGARASVEALMRECAFIERVARSRGDAWAAEVSQ